MLIFGHKQELVMCVFHEMWQDLERKNETALNSETFQLCNSYFKCICDLGITNSVVQSVCFLVHTLLFHLEQHFT